MNVRKFKPGNRVQPKAGGPVMEVIKYVTEHRVFVGDVYSDHDVLCVWYDDNKDRHEEVFDQRCLFRIEKEHALA